MPISHEAASARTRKGWETRRRRHGASGHAAYGLQGERSYPKAGETRAEYTELRAAERELRASRARDHKLAEEYEQYAHKPGDSKATRARKTAARKARREAADREQIRAGALIGRINTLKKQIRRGEQGKTIKELVHEGYKSGKYHTKAYGKKRSK